MRLFGWAWFIGGMVIALVELKLANRLGWILFDLTQAIIGVIFIVGWKEK